PTVQTADEVVALDVPVGEQCTTVQATPVEHGVLVTAADDHEVDALDHGAGRFAVGYLAPGRDAYEVHARAPDGGPGGLTSAPENGHVTARVAYATPSSADGVDARGLALGARERVVQRASLHQPRREPLGRDRLAQVVPLRDVALERRERLPRDAVF